MSMTLSPAEETQLSQTIEMFEVIAQSQPQDYQSLEILKEAYTKLGRDKDAMGASKRIAQAYVEMGQLSSAILEYETILQRHPNDPDVVSALKRIESKAATFPLENIAEVPVQKPAPAANAKTNGKPANAATDDGRQTMHKLFVDSKVISAADFDLCWSSPDLSESPKSIEQPFVQALADKGILPVEKSLKIISDRSRCAFLYLGAYDLDMDLARSFRAETCRRWCVLPFDRMSKSIVIATANPFNQQAAKELAEDTKSRLLWYLTPPADLVKIIGKAFR